MTPFILRYDQLKCLRGGSYLISWDKWGYTFTIRALEIQP